MSLERSGLQGVNLKGKSLKWGRIVKRAKKEDRSWQGNKKMEVSDTGGKCEKINC